VVHGVGVPARDGVAWSAAAVSAAPTAVATTMAMTVAGFGSHGPGRW
jgi:hypothetical protein